MRQKTATGFIDHFKHKDDTPAMAMADLARREDERAVSPGRNRRTAEISLSYLEQLFARLRRRGLVRSSRGPGGGYRLARTAEETNIAEIVLAVDEPIRATRCGGQGSRHLS